MWIQEPIMFDVAYRLARRIVTAIVGATVLAVGIAMMVLPGPAFIVIPIGLGILGLEFAWARRWLKAAKDKAEAALAMARSATSTGPGPGSAPPPGTSPQ